jgi:tRNA threonylcarbamoyladenosine biosynthesis protein TsaE
LEDKTGIPNSMEWKISGIHDLKIPASAIADLLKKRHVLAISGSLGAGKTTFVKVVINLLGSRDITSSPSFSLVNEYHYPDGVLYHMDMYRLKDMEEALNIGVEDYLYSGEICIVEWPELIDSLLPEDAIRLHIESISPSERRIILAE